MTVLEWVGLESNRIRNDTFDHYSCHDINLALLESLFGCSSLLKDGRTLGTASTRVRRM